MVPGALVWNHSTRVTTNKKDSLGPIYKNLRMEIPTPSPSLEVCIPECYFPGTGFFQKNPGNSFQCPSLKWIVIFVFFHFLNKIWNLKSGLSTSHTRTAWAYLEIANTNLLTSEPSAFPNTLSLLTLTYTHTYLWKIQHCCNNFFYFLILLNF